MYIICRNVYKIFKVRYSSGFLVGETNLHLDSISLRVSIYISTLTY